ncbi:ATP phosphoribosyltransferase regulatory subunit [Gracilibacillus halotolerans]|uniref:ATP phosphoribosyltransferase regulatory subunit n=1 Tax=Gracilibacillus halotolerans TaxID=74386 RepID=UPI0031B58430
MNTLFLPEGSQDETGNLISNRLTALEIFRRITNSRNFRPISTPVVEYASTFTNDVAGMDLQWMLKWFNSDGEIEVLRPDWTAAIARAIASQHPSERKWTYQGSVFRMDKHGTENRQAGIEIVHEERFLGESESLLTAAAYLNELNISNYVIELSHTGIFEGILTLYPLNDEQKRQLHDAMYEKQEDYVKEILKNTNAESLIQPLIELMDAYGSREIIDEYKQRWQDTPSLLEILDQIEELIRLLEQAKVPEVIIDLGRVKNLPYYDGIMFRGFLVEDGSTCFSGGRYDRLYKQFELQTSAVGLAFDVDVLAKHMPVIQPSEKLCFIVDSTTHAYAEQYRIEHPDLRIDIRYSVDSELVYDRIYHVIKDRETYKVVER